MVGLAANGYPNYSKSIQGLRYKCGGGGWGGGGKGKLQMIDAGVVLRTSRIDDFFFF